MRAARTTSGMPIVRVFRSKAILLMLALSCVAAMALEREQVPEYAPALQRLEFQAVIEKSAHQRLRLLLGPRIGVVVPTHVEERAAGYDRVGRCAVDLDRTALRFVAVGPGRVDRAAARAVAVQRHGIAELLQQRSLEGAQRGGGFPVRGELLERAPVAREQGGGRVLARKQAQQQLFHEEPAHQRLAFEPGTPADPLRARERPDFAL